MAEHRPFPPSPRRRALARRAGLHAASPRITGAVAGAAIVVAAGALGGTAAHQLGAAIVAACSAGAATTATATAAALPAMVLGLALPLAGAAAIAAVVAHLAQTRAAWLPRRRIPGAPGLDASAGPRVRRAGGALAAAVVIAGVGFGWLWSMAPRLAALASLAPIATPGAPATAPLLATTAAVLVSLAGALVVAWAALGVLDAVVRHAGLARGLAMTAREQRDDARLAGADPRWRARRAAIQRGPGASDAIAGASLLVLGDDAAVAVAWDPARRPIPVRTAAGRGPHARQLLGLARRHRLAIHRDPALAAALVDGDGPIPEPHWPRLAEVIAAIREPL